MDNIKVDDSIAGMLQINVHVYYVTIAVGQSMV